MLSTILGRLFNIRPLLTSYHYSEAPMSGGGSLHHYAAIDHEQLASHVIRFTACQE